MRTILMGTLIAVGFSLAAATSISAAPVSGPASRAAPPATLLDLAQYCRCGRVCYGYDYYGRCVSWRCRACNYRPYRYYRY